MIAKLTNGTLIPLHWDDRFYIATCPECSEEVWAKTSSEIAEILEIHCQGIAQGDTPDSVTSRRYHLVINNRRV